METFIIRLWRPSPEQPSFQGEMHGVVDHVASGGRATFAGEQALLEAIQRLRGNKPQDTTPEGGLK